MASVTRIVLSSSCSVLPWQTVLGFGFSCNVMQCVASLNATPLSALHRERSSMDDGGSSLSSASYGSCSSTGNEEVHLKIHVPELSVEKCLTFHQQDLVWTVKQAALTSLPKVSLFSKKKTRNDCLTLICFSFCYAYCLYCLKSLQM